MDLTCPDEFPTGGPGTGSPKHATWVVQRLDGLGALITPNCVAGFHAAFWAPQSTQLCATLALDAPKCARLWFPGGSGVTRHTQPAHWGSLQSPLQCHTTRCHPSPPRRHPVAGVEALASTITEAKASSLPFLGRTQVQT